MEEMQNFVYDTWLLNGICLICPVTTAEEEVAAL